MTDLDYSKLKGKITEVFGSQKAFAEAMGQSPQTLSAKLTGNTGFRQEEIIKASQLLLIEESDIPDYFFTQRVSNGNF